MKQTMLMIAAKGALAALSQAKTYPADVEAARTWLRDAIRTTEALEGKEDAVELFTLDELRKEAE